LVDTQFNKNKNIFNTPEIKKKVVKSKAKKVKPLSRNSSKLRSLKKKTSKASKSFSDLNSKNLIPRVGKNFNRDKQRKMKNYLYENDKNYGSKLRSSNSIFNNRKTKKCYSLIGDSVRRLKYDRKEVDSQKLAGNKRRLRNLVRDKSLKLMQDYSNKNLSKKRKTDKPKKDKMPKPENFNQIIEDKLRLLKTKLVHKSYEDSKVKKNGEPKPPTKDIISAIDENTSDNQAEEEDIPVAPFNSITMREVTPRFQQDSTEKSNVLKNSSILKKRTGNIFESDYYDSTGKKGIKDNSFSLGEFIRKHDPTNIFNTEENQTIEEGHLQVFNVRNIRINKIGKIDQIIKDPLLRVRVLDHLRVKYTQIMNN